MSISGRKNIAQIRQGITGRHQHGEHHVFEDAIMEECGVQCSVKITDQRVSIRTPDYASFILAKNVLKNRTDLEIIRG